MNILETIKERVVSKFPNQTLYPNRTVDLIEGRLTTRTVSAYVCHSSCHGACHSSRGRR